MLNRGKGEFFSGLEGQSQAANKVRNERRRIDAAEVMEASNDVLLKQNGEGQFLQQKVIAGETSYNLDEYLIGKDTTEA